MQRGRLVALWLRQAVRRLRTPGRSKGWTFRICRPGLVGLLPMLPLAASYMLSYLFRKVNGVVAPDIMRDLGVGADALGLLTSIAFLTFAAAQLPIGVLLDRYGSARVQFVLLLCAAAGSGLSAVNSGFAGLLLGRALIGLGTAGSLVAGLKAAAAWFPKEQLARVNGALLGHVNALATQQGEAFACCRGGSGDHDWAEALLLAHPGLPSLLPWCVFAVFGGITVLSYSVLADHFPTAAIGHANGALNVGHI